MNTLYIAQKLFSVFGSFDVTDTDGKTVYRVQGEFAWTKKLIVYDRFGAEVGMIRGVFSFLPKYEVWIHGRKAGEIRQEFSLLRPKFAIDFMGWQAQGNFLGLDYQITNGRGEVVGSIDKELWHLTDHYAIHFDEPEDALPVLMLVLAVDAVYERNAAFSSGAAAG